MGVLRLFAGFGFILILSACASAPEIPYDHSTADVHTIGLPTPGVPSGPSIVLASSIGQSFGLVGALVDAGMQANRDSTFSGVLVQEHFVPADEFSHDLEEALREKGYTVVPYTVGRGKPDFLKQVPDAPASVDAYLDVVMHDYGYIAAGIGGSTPYRPFLTLECKLVRKSDSAVLMQDTIVLNSPYPSKNQITLSPDPDYEFPTFDNLVADPKKATTGVGEAFAQSTSTIGRLLE